MTLKCFARLNDWLRISYCTNCSLRELKGYIKIPLTDYYDLCGRNQLKFCNYQISLFIKYKRILKLYPCHTRANLESFLRHVEELS